MDRPPFILAGDLATKAGFAEGRPGEIPKLYTKRFGEDGDSHLKICSRALGFIAWRLADDTAEDRPDFLFIEAAMPLGAAIRGKSNARAIIRLNALNGIIGAAAILKSIPVTEVDVKAARQVFIGHRDLERDEAKRRAKGMCKMLGWPCANVDEADAAAIWHYGCSVKAPRAAVIIHPGMHRKLAGALAGIEVKELFA